MALKERDPKPAPAPEVHPAAKQEPDKSKPAKGINGRGFWDQLNWELRNPDLADAWQKKEQTVRQMRCRFRYGRAVKCGPEQYEQKLAAEKERAKAYGQSHPTTETQPI